MKATLDFARNAGYHAQTRIECQTERDRYDGDTHHVNDETSKPQFARHDDHRSKVRCRPDQKKDQRRSGT